MQDETIEKVNDTEQAYIDEIKSLKENTVSKEIYDKKVEENKKLIKALREGSKLEGQEQEQDMSIDELKKDLANYNKLSNREFAEKTLKLREKVIEAGGRDPLMPSDPNYIPSADDEKEVNSLVEAWSGALEEAQGDDEVFNMYMQRVLVK